MASALSLLQQSQTDHTDTLGVTYIVDYQHLGGSLEVGLSCFVSNREFDNREKKIIQNLTMFSSLALSTQPKMRDTVTIDGVGYTVVRFEYNHGRWIVYAEDDVKHTGKRYPK